MNMRYMRYFNRRFLTTVMNDGGEECLYHHGVCTSRLSVISPALLLPRRRIHKLWRTNQLLCQQ